MELYFKNMHIVHHMNIRMIHYLVPMLFPKVTIHNNIIIENTDTIHNILTNQIGIIHYSHRHQLLIF